MKLALILSLCVSTFAVVEHKGNVNQQIYDRPDDSGGASPNEVLRAHGDAGARLLKPGAEEGLPVGWENDDEVEVSYCEHVLAAWVLQGSPWTAFHSGFSFKNKRTGATYCIDYCPVYTDDVRVVLAPELKNIKGTGDDPDSVVTKAKKALGLKVNEGDAEMSWRNKGLVRFYTATPKKYTNLTALAKTDGATFHKMVNWAMEYNNTYDTFDPVEIVIEGKPERRVSSRMCHDLVSAGLWFLYEEKVPLHPEKPIYRDHIILFAKDYEAISEEKYKEPAIRKEIISYFRLFTSWLPLIAKEFTSIRGMLVHANAGKFYPFLYINHVYYKVDIQPPFVNYCYMPIPMPPAKANAFTSQKYCGLEQSLSAKNEKHFLMQAAGLGLQVAGIKPWMLVVGGVVVVLVLVMMCGGKKDNTNDGKTNKKKN